MSWFRSDSRKERDLSGTVDMPQTMARSATSWQSSDAAATSAQAPLDARRAAEAHRAATLERVTRRDDSTVEDAVVKTERRDGAPAPHRGDAATQQREDMQARQRDDAKALRRDETQAQPRDDVPTQPTDDAQAQRDGKNPQAQRPGDTHAPSMNDEQLPPLFSAEVAQTFRARWDAAQTNFVDDPRQAVLQADELVEEMIKSLAHSFAQERARQMNETGSTENMRLALRRYRSLFQRMLSL